MKANIRNRTIFDVDVHAKAEVFIIPNPAGVVSSNPIGREAAEYASKITDANGIVYHESFDKLVEFWWTSDDLKSDNLARHGFKIVKDDDNVIFCRNWYTKWMGHLPAKLFADLKEGETKTINVPIHIPDENEEDVPECNIMLHLDVTASQLKYRYARFGKFEDVLTEVCN